MREGRVWLALVGGLGLVFVWALNSDSDAPNEVSPEVAPARVATSTAPVAQLQAPVSPAAKPPTPPRAASVASEDTKVPACDPAAADSKPSGADDAKVLHDLDAALAERSSERAEAVRHFIAMAGAELVLRAARERAGQDCDEQSCGREIGVARARSLNALARMAVRTLDPAIYAVAYQFCRKREQDCQMISARQWARLDPHNAVPWLHVAAEAAAERNESGVAEAMYQVARASRSDAYESALMREVVAAFPKELTPAQHGSVAVLLVGAEAAWAAPGMQTAARYCSNINTRDANRRLLCNDVAETLFRRSNTFVEQTVGLRIGQRSGWSAEKVEAAQMERDALMQVMHQQTRQNKEMSSCERGVVAIRALRLLAERGEVGAAREALRRSGKSMAEWAGAYRAERERELQKAAAARRPAAPVLAPAPGG